MTIRPLRHSSDSKFVDRVPVFHGETYDEHTEAWWGLERRADGNLWARCAIAVSLDRLDKTLVTEFCRDVLISRR